MASSGGGGGGAAAAASAGASMPAANANAANAATVENWTLKEVIGHGSFATVWKAVHKDTHKEAAVKEINTERLNKKLLESLASEIAVLQRVNHPHIVNLYETIKRPEKSRIYLVLEYCSGSDLSRYVKKTGRLSEDKAAYFMRQLCEGLKHLRGLNLMHRDLKPQNLLLSSEDQSAVLKIADFGFARDLSIHGLADTLCGSPLYMAPEILQYKQYDVKADLWSVGAILFELICGAPPYTGANHIQLLKSIEQREARLPDSLELSNECKHLIYSLLKRNPIERLSFEGLFKHPFITGDKQQTISDSHIKYVKQRIGKSGISMHTKPMNAGQRGLAHGNREKYKEEMGMKTKDETKFDSNEKGSCDSLEKEYVLIQTPSGQSDESPTSSSAPKQSFQLSKKLSIGSTDMFRQFAVKSSLKGSEDIGSTGKVLKDSNIKLAIQRPENNVERILLFDKCAAIIESQAENQEDACSGFALFLFGAKLLECCCRMIESEKASNVAHDEIDFNDLLKGCFAKMEIQLTKAQALAESRVQDQCSSDSLPDALDLIYNEALVIARKGAVEEIMGNFAAGAESYFCALNLLFFICTEAKDVPLDPPLVLSQADQSRVYTYILNIQERYSTCAQSIQK